MPYKFLEEVAIADVAFEASGETVEELFESAGAAITNTMVKDLKKVEQKSVKRFEVEADGVEMLLFNFLQELIFYKDAEQLLFSKFNLQVAQNGDKWHLISRACGEEIDPRKHELLVDVKAVSLHRFKVEKTAAGWQAMVIVDV